MIVELLPYLRADFIDFLLNVPELDFEAPKDNQQKDDRKNIEIDRIPCVHQCSSFGDCGDTHPLLTSATMVATHPTRFKTNSGPDLRKAGIRTHSASSFIVSAIVLARNSS
jgi:hypothetical protein